MDTHTLGTTPSADEILALDILTLKEHTERADDIFDIDQHRARLQQSLAVNTLCTVRDAGQLVAYAMLRPEANDCWFVGGFCLHPAHRTPTVINALFAQVVAIAQQEGITALKSHVYKTNALSLAFHRKLGFQVIKENEKAVEFFAPLSTLINRPAIHRAARGRVGITDET